MSKLKVGDRVRLKVRLLNGYKGEATVLRIDHQDGLEDLIDIWPDSDTSPMYGQRGVACLRHEVAKIRKQGPNHRSVPDSHTQTPALIRPPITQAWRQTMSERDNGNGNIINNQNEAPTMSDRTAATTVNNNQDAVYAGGPSCWERTGPKPNIHITAEHCIVTNARLVRRLDEKWATCFHLHLGNPERKAFQCIAFDEAHSDLEDGTLVTVTGYLHPFDWVEPSEVDPNDHMLIVESLREEVEYLRVVQDAPTAFPPGAKPW